MKFKVEHPFSFIIRRSGRVHKIYPAGSIIEDPNPIDVAGQEHKLSKIGRAKSDGAQTIDNPNPEKGADPKPSANISGDIEKAKQSLGG